MTSYYYQGKAVELVPNQQYTTHWNFYWHEGGQRVIRSGQPGIDLLSSPVQSPVVLSEEEETLSTSIPSTLKINEASFTDIRKTLPGIGRIAAKALTNNRPKEGGYRDFDHLLELNKSEVGATVNWEEVKVKLEF